MPILYNISGINYGTANVFSFSILNLLVLILQTSCGASPSFFLLAKHLLSVAYIPNLLPKTLVNLSTSCLVKLSVHINVQLSEK